MFGAKRTIMAMVMTPEGRELFGIMGDDKDQLVMIADPEETLDMLCSSDEVDAEFSGERENDRVLKVEAGSAGFELRISFFVGKGAFRWQ